MGAVHPAVASEELASLLQDLDTGQHIAVSLGPLDIAAAFQVSRRAAAERGDQFLVVADPEAFNGAVLADSLGQALPFGRLVAGEGADTLLVVDAQASVRRGGADQHAHAERALMSRTGLRLTIVCFYTEEALAALSERAVRTLHAMVAAPGQV